MPVRLITVAMLPSSLRKISQALGFSARDHHGRVDLAQAPDNAGKDQDRPEPRTEEYDRLLHRRKGLAGSEFAGLGIQFAATIVVFAFAGIWLDKRLGTSPVFVLVMVLGGAALGFWAMVRRLR
jgi:hypothetical protein